MRNLTSAFSLIEVLIFSAILSLFFVIAASVTVGVLRDIKINEHKILATRYANELAEWMNGEKEKGWNDFKADFYTGLHCFPSLSIQAPPCDTPIGSTIFTRSASTEVDDLNEEVTATISVGWSDLGTANSVEIVKVFKPWE